VLREEGKRARETEDGAGSVGQRMTVLCWPLKNAREAREAREAMDGGNRGGER
jgi:hypothetical protein